MLGTDRKTILLGVQKGGQKLTTDSKEECWGTDRQTDSKTECWGKDRRTEVEDR